MRKIAVITPVSHLKGIINLIQSKGDVFFHEEASKICGNVTLFFF